MSIKSILIFFVILSALSCVASATTWTFGNPMGMGFTNIPGDQFVITNNNASTGYIASVGFDLLGSYTQLIRINNCNNCLYGLINPTDGSVWGADEQGSVFYTRNLYGTVNYAAGFYTAGVGGSCTGAGGNCNPLYKASAFTATTRPIRLAVDSSGNVYANDGLTIIKFVRSLSYGTQSFYILPASPNAAAGFTWQVYGINIDTSDNLYLYAGEYRGTTVNAADIVSKLFVINPSGVLSTSYQLPHLTHVNNGGSGGIVGGGLIIDATNPTQNFTYGIGNASGQWIFHNSTAGHVDITGTGDLSDISAINDIGYNNFQIYVAGDTNTIKTYVTNWEGYGVSTGAPSNPDGITGTYTWLNGLSQSTTTISPGASLAYRWTISTTDLNYTFYSGWGADTSTYPNDLHELTDLTGLGMPAVFTTSSNDLAGTDIYGYILAKRKNDSTWSILAVPTKLTITPSTSGFDSITISKTFFNLTGDTIQATFTYSSGYPPYLYQWQLCSRADCSDGSIFNLISLIGEPSTSSMSTNGMAQGNYYAVLMRHLPFLSNTIVASQRLEIRPPVIGVSWDKTTYNLLPKSLLSSCFDSTPLVSYWSNISGYAGLQYGWFSCSTTPADASANNSIMRGSLYARYNGTFYLNNSLGNIWNGTLNNGSGALIYVLTNSSATEVWTLVGVNASGETFYATTEVAAESDFEYSISVNPNVAYNKDTIYLTFTRPIYRLLDYVIIKDAGGNTLTSFDSSAKSGSYVIDPSKQYVYGTWTAYWSFGSGGLSPNTQGKEVYTFTVKNSGRPQKNASTISEDSPEYTSSVIIDLMSSKIFWALLFICGIMLAISTRERRGN